MKRTTFLSVAIACVLGLTSCVHDGPVKILLASSQSESGRVRMSLEHSGAPVDTIPNTVTFDVRGPLPDLGDRLLAWSIGRRRKPAGELAKIAFAMNVQGVVEKIDDNAYVVKDTTGKSHFANLFVDEAGGWWTYTNGAQQSESGCPAGDTSCEKQDLDVRNVLSPGEAIRRTNQILDRADMVPLNYPLDAVSTADSTVVTGFLTLGGIKTNLAVQFIFDRKGEVVSASGPMIAIAMAGRYPILTPAEAVKRLNNPLFATIGSVTRLAATASISQSSDASSSSETVVPITSVRFTLMEAKLANLTHMLLPAYTYFNAEGEVGTVLAIADDRLAFSRDAVITTETVPIRGGDVPTQPTQPLDENTAQQLLGLPEAEATKVAMERGWVVRIAARDGEFFMLTQDYSGNRVNLSVKNGKVIAITIG